MTDQSQNARAQLVCEALHRALAPYAGKHRPDTASVRRSAERALRALRDAGALPDGMDISVRVLLAREVTPDGRRHFSVRVRWSDELGLWIKANGEGQVMS